MANDHLPLRLDFGVSWSSKSFCSCSLGAALRDRIKRRPVPMQQKGKRSSHSIGLAKSLRYLAYISIDAAVKVVLWPNIVHRLHKHSKYRRYPTVLHPTFPLWAYVTH